MDLIKKNKIVISILVIGIILCIIGASTFDFYDYDMENYYKDKVLISDTYELDNNFTNLIVESQGVNIEFIPTTKDNTKIIFDRYEDSTIDFNYTNDYNTLLINANKKNEPNKLIFNFISSLFYDATKITVMYDENILFDDMHFDIKNVKLDLDNSVARNIYVNASNSNIKLSDIKSDFFKLDIKNSNVNINDITNYDNNIIIENSNVEMDDSNFITSDINTSNSNVKISANLKGKTDLKIENSNFKLYIDDSNTSYEIDEKIENSNFKVTRYTQNNSDVKVPINVIGSNSNIKFYFD